MKQLSATDSIFVYNDSSRTPLHIAPLLIYQPPGKGQEPVRFKQVLDRFQERLHKSPVFRRKLSKVALDLDRPYWVEDSEFDLEFHVRHMALPKPGDWRQFCILLARLHSRPLDLTRPPWEAYIIEGLDNINGLPKGSFALYMKIHHSAIDGATGNQMVAALHDLQPDAVTEPASDSWQGENEPGQALKLGRAYFKLFSAPRRVSAIVRHAIKSNSNAVRELSNRGTEDHRINKLTRFNENVSAHRVFGGLRMQLTELKQIKNAVADCTLNDVLLSIVAGAVRHYLLAKDELPEQSLVVGVPISTRTEENSNADGGNDVAGMRLRLCTDIAEPLERLQAINEDAVNSKVYANAIGVERMLTVLNSIPSGVASLGMRAMAVTGLSARNPLANTIVTNVPGPQFPLYFCGAEASVWAGLGCILDGMGLFHTINSYNGVVFLSFVSCRDMIPDPDFYHQCMNGSLQEHQDAAAAVATRSVPKLKASRAKTKTRARLKTSAKAREKVEA